ncbi:MAG: CRISPR-associated endonuclease Cas2 [Candidatus Zambryskibacteria bacterium RIFCSPLOWO2_12_FULL_45_14]|uniref:CRISPR-associated endonuclease Cas2 n=2 Tax=Candidatus Zambryskiibacteriota TaxID=1817925 RepID=A0A1G2UKL9_9BACT|nr:MAG: CRISPR-associated endonuclease Cas2 [Candidatus Zambryskibacteria bacterium RIFCSPLOWO2_02_FULL_44_12b]OHB13826.1 MAG: CRISPR-associated endonuclease Cas2 [Candidatus Zambryskibacteria bacterium RIFCSPLOWO2_12_FULL_45_14]
MGKLEEENKKVIRRTKIQEAILLTIVSGGRLGAKLIPKLVLETITGLDLSAPPRANEIIKTATNRLKKKGLLKFENRHYSLTADGEKILDRWRRADFKITKPKKWDRRWRIIIFDIPERKKKIRDEIRGILTAVGFQRLQDSVWVYPYDCEDIIGLLKVDYGISRDMLYIIADQIENDKYLRMDFDLVS